MNRGGLHWKGAGQLSWFIALLVDDLSSPFHGISFWDHGRVFQKKVGRPIFMRGLRLRRNFSVSEATGEVAWSFFCMFWKMHFGFVRLRTFSLSKERGKFAGSCHGVFHCRVESFL
jgi:hypothetical protein